MRTYSTCSPCGQGVADVDRLLGLDGFLTRQAIRLVCLTGNQIGFAAASAMLLACCGWTSSDETIRTACKAQSRRIAKFQATPIVAAAFAEVSCEVEYQLDGTTLNTTGGWRDMKFGTFALRELSLPATAADRNSRPLPVPTARVAFAAIEPIEAFAPRIGQYWTLPVLASVGRFGKP